MIFKQIPLQSTNTSSDLKTGEKSVIFQLPDGFNFFTEAGLNKDDQNNIRIKGS